MDVRMLHSVDFVFKFACHIINGFCFKLRLNPHNIKTTSLKCTILALVYSQCCVVTTSIKFQKIFITPQKKPALPLWSSG